MARYVENQNETTILKFDELLHQTEKAYLLRFGDEEEWLPVSQMENFDEDNCTVEIADWLVEKKGLESYEED